MAFDIEKEIKIYWICATIVLLIYGVWEFLGLIGALYIAWAIVLIRIYKDIDNWEKIKNWVLFGILENILMAITQVIYLTVYNVPIWYGLLGLIILIVFAIVGIHIWIRKRKES